MEIIQVYVEALPLREDVLHIEGEEIELPIKKEEELPSVSQEEEREESPPAPDESFIESLSIPDRALVEEEIIERERVEELV
jgi:hypothetical protein